jgi:Reverse transcriptase (RNA-dependent DNA polymerase)/Retroviral aspartyl protease/RNase H-like domain found in reverse transcriptase/Retrotransposon gag protein
MVTQATFDRSMEELRAKLDEMTTAQCNTYLRLQQEAERTSQHFAQ